MHKPLVFPILSCHIAISMPQFESRCIKYFCQIIFMTLNLLLIVEFSQPYIIQYVLHPAAFCWLYHYPLLSPMISSSVVSCQLSFTITKYDNNPPRYTTILSNYLHDLEALADCCLQPCVILLYVHHCPSCHLPQTVIFPC